MLVVINLVYEVLPPQLPLLGAAKTMETGTLLNAISAALSAAVDGFDQLEQLPDEVGHAAKDRGKSDVPLAAAMNTLGKAAR